ncbi:MAG: ATP-dependent transcriptional regulator, partial [Pseudomonadota bacterium]
AERFYRQAPGTALHQAYSASQLAAYAVNEGDGVKALSILGPHLATAQRYENAALLATLLLLRAEALELTGRVAEAQTIRLDSVGWARYGFGDDWAVRAKASEISSQRQKAATNG